MSGGSKTSAGGSGGGTGGLPFERPEDLDGADGIRAWDLAVKALEEMDRDPGLFIDAIDRYARAVQRAADMRGGWEDAGSPMTTLGGSSGSVVVEHPHIRMIERAEELAAKLGAAVGLDPTPKNRGGRPVGATSAPDRRSAGEPAKFTAARRRKPARPSLKSVK